MAISLGIYPIFRQTHLYILMVMDINGCNGCNGSERIDASCIDSLFFDGSIAHWYQYILACFDKFISFLTCIIYIYYIYIYTASLYIYIYILCIHLSLSLSLLTLSSSANPSSYFAPLHPLDHDSQCLPTQCRHPHSAVAHHRKSCAGGKQGVPDPNRGSAEASRA